MRLNAIIAGALGVLVGAAAVSVAAPELNLRGDRFRPLKYEELTPAQKVLADRELASPSRSGGGPLNIFLRSPEYAEMARPLSAYLRFQAPFPEKLKELTIMLTGRFWGGTYVWWSHRPFAIKAGLSEDLIQALAKGERPANMRPDEATMYDFVTELLQTRQIRDTNFKAMAEKFGERGIVETIATMGHFTGLTMLFVADKYPVPPGAPDAVNKPM